MAKFRIFKWSNPCWKCQKVTGRIIAVLEEEVIPTIPDDELGGKLSERYPTFYAKLHSPFEKKEVWCNFCVHCEARQGNYYLNNGEWINDRIKQSSNSIEKVLMNGLCSEDSSIEIIQGIIDASAEAKSELTEASTKTSIDSPPFCPKCKTLAIVNSDNRMRCTNNNCGFHGLAEYLPTPERKEKMSQPYKRNHGWNDKDEYRNHL